MVTVGAPQRSVGGRWPLTVARRRRPLVAPARNLPVLPPPLLPSPAGQKPPHGAASIIPGLGSPAKGLMGWAEPAWGGGVRGKRARRPARLHLLPSPPQSARGGVATRARCRQAPTAAAAASLLHAQSPATPLLPPPTPPPPLGLPLPFPGDAAAGALSSAPGCC